jgi:hypothetical protein
MDRVGDWRAAIDKGADMVGSGIQMVLQPFESIYIHRLTPAADEVIQRAALLADEVGGDRVTSSLLLFAMVELGAGSPRDDALRFLHDYTLGSDPDAYRGVKAAYLAWYRRSCLIYPAAPGTPPHRPMLTPYLPAILRLAADFASAQGSAGEVDIDHLLAALLTFDPGLEQVQPGIQYILCMARPGWQDLTQVLTWHLQQAARRDSAAARHWWISLQPDTYTQGAMRPI